MPFRTLEISKPAEVHVCKGQLVVTNEEGTISIPLEDLSTIVCSGPNIRYGCLCSIWNRRNGQQNTYMCNDMQQR